jgi:hypothetical protein
MPQHLKLIEKQVSATEPKQGTILKDIKYI